MTKGMSSSSSLPSFQFLSSVIWRLFLLLCLFATTVVKAQVPVSKEPHHHKVLDNKYVRVLDVHLMPGDTSQVHIHATPSVFVILDTVHSGSQVLQETKGTRLPTGPGEVYFEGFYASPRIHRVWNSDTKEFHVMDIELPNTDPRASAPLPGFPAPFIEERHVRVYKIDLPAHGSLKVPSVSTPVLIILFSQIPDGKVIIGNTSLSKTGAFDFLPASHASAVVNDQPGSARLYVLQLN